MADASPTSATARALDFTNTIGVNTHISWKSPGSAYADAGVTYKGLLPGRVNDTLGLGVAFARFSDQVSKADSDAVLAGSPRPIRRGETVVELTYQAEIAPWWQVQPVAQYIIRPSGEADPNRPERRLRDTLVLGMRTNITF